jgi:hypothetical protein
MATHHKDQLDEDERAGTPPPGRPAWAALSLVRGPHAGCDDACKGLLLQDKGLSPALAHAAGGHHAPDVARDVLGDHGPAQAAHDHVGHLDVLVVPEGPVRLCGSEFLFQFYLYILPQKKNYTKS